MQTGHSMRCVPSYRLLTADQIEELHRATLVLLDTVGVRVLHPGARDMLAAAGARVTGDDVVCIPNHLVEAAIASAPSVVTVYNRRGEPAMELGGRNAYFGLGTDLLDAWDLDTGELRKACLKDVVNAAVTADYLEEIDFIASMAHPQDVPTHMVYIESFRAQVEHSIKPIYFTAAGRPDLEVILEIAAAVAGGTAQLRRAPFLIHYAEPTSPLTHSNGALEKLFLCADAGVPLNYVPALLAGGSGPVTLAGAIVTANAEALSGLVIQQLRAKGAPMISGFSATPMDMQTGTTLYGSPDERLTHSACCDLYHHYGLPVWGEAGCSDSKCLDEQAALESAISILMAAQDGCNLIHDIGYLGEGLVGSPAAIVMCAEIIGYVRRIMRGFELSPDHLGLDAVAQVGPGGNFLDAEHTFRHHRHEIWRPHHLDRRDPESWKAAGAPTYRETVTAKARDILAGHAPEPLSQDTLGQIRTISRRAVDALADTFFHA